LASKITNFVGLFDYLRTQYGLKASDVVEIMDAYPEFAYQNKKSLMQKKLSLIKKHSKKGETYMRTLIKRHPDMLLR
jgi:hypothetical protein